ncbi:hypothetical protein A0H81_10137 [Grifola frondosa]|uniref:C2H2-type domain-containing protein n=1 Tax=Grifola frondosa TaxID=5627 RepID=A0A1C7LZS8_GRIFR|nr:hypothetical protein A0H81_10137 [Grifola frondosa]
MTEFESASLFHCNWNWCPDTFTHGRDLIQHLKKEHWNNILAIKKKDIGAYLRSTEGRSGATDSVMGAISSQSFVMSTQNSMLSSVEKIATPEIHSDSVMGATPSQPLSAPLRTYSSPSIAHGNDRGTHSGTPASSPPAHQPSTPPPRARNSFASCAAQSSPISTPLRASPPPSPMLSNMIADAINSAGRINAATRNKASPRSSRKVLPLPRNMGQRLSTSPTKSSLLLPERGSPSSESATSAQVVEDQLTQSLAPSPGTQSPPQPASGAPTPAKSYPVLRTQAPYQSQGDSSGEDSHGASSLPSLDAPRQSSASARLHPLLHLHLLYLLHTRTSAPPPIPPPTRTLRSRSKTPASATPSLPLPRRRASSRTTPEPVSRKSTSRGTSQSGTNSSTRAKRKHKNDIVDHGGLVAVEEEAEGESTSQPLGSASGPSFRSGTIYLKPDPNAMDVDHTVEGDDPDAEGIADDDADSHYQHSHVGLPQNQNLQASSIESDTSQYTASQSFVFDFYDSLPLQTQPPYYSESQSQ